MLRTRNCTATYFLPGSGVENPSVECTLLANLVAMTRTFDPSPLPLITIGCPRCAGPLACADDIAGLPMAWVGSGPATALVSTALVSTVLFTPPVESSLH